MKNTRRTVSACMIGFVSQAFIVNILILFYSYIMKSYGLTYTDIANLSLFGAIVQLLCDLLSPYVIKKMGFRLVGIISSCLTIVGIIFFICVPSVPVNNVYLMFMLGYLFINIGVGFFEILINSMVFNLKVKNHGKVLSLVHGSYSFGVVALVFLTSLLIYLLGVDKWTYIISIWIILPLLTIVMFSISEMPENGTKQTVKQEFKKIKDPYFILCMFLLFFLGSVEIMITFWMSTFVERALDMNKFISDLIAVGGFSIGIALVRIIYSKVSSGKRVEYFMITSIVFAIISLCLVTVSFNKVLVMIGCMLSGFCLSMLWPGTLMLSGSRFPSSSAFMFAVLAAAGDSALAIGPWMLGKISDSAQNWDLTHEIASKYGITQLDNITMRMGIFLGVCFLSIGLIINIILLFMRKKYEKSQLNCKEI